MSDGLVKTSEVGYGRPPVAHRFRPGQSGNPAGRPRGPTRTSMALALRSRLDESGSDGATLADQIVSALIALALAGNRQAIRYIFARVDGHKPARQPFAPPDRMSLPAEMTPPVI